MEAESAMILLFSLLVLALAFELVVAISCSISVFNFSLIVPAVLAFTISFHKSKKEILKKSAATKVFDNLQVGHRGCRLPNYVENTLPAIFHAIELGAEAVEIDIRLCKDDVPIVFHDCSFHRLLDVEGRVEDYTYEQIKQMRFRNHPTVGIPRLEEVLDVVKEKNVKLMIESKERRLLGKMAEVLAKLYKERDLYTDACVISFNPFFLWLLNRADPRIITCFLYKNNLYSGWAKSGTEELSPFLQKTATWVDFFLTFSAETILPALVGSTMIGPHRNKASASYIEQWRSKGYSIYFWVTNTKEEWLWMRSNRVSVSTDFPHLFELTKPTKGDVTPRQSPK